MERKNSFWIEQGFKVNNQKTTLGLPASGGFLLPNFPLPNFSTTQFPQYQQIPHSSYPIGLAYGVRVKSPDVQRLGGDREIEKLKIELLISFPDVGRLGGDRENVKVKVSQNSKLKV